MKVMKVKLNEKFKLPFLGKDAFIALSKAGLKYDRKSRMFFIDSDTNVELVNNILSELAGIKIIIPKKCAICDDLIDCDECDLNEACDKKQIYCVCLNCLNTKSFSDYVDSQKAFLLNYS